MGIWGEGVGKLGDKINQEGLIENRRIG